MPAAQKQLDTFLKKYSPQIGTLGRLAIRHLIERLPGAICLIYDNYNALAVGFGPGRKAGDVVISLALYPRWATLFFMQGATLPDPDGLLEGKGSRIRSVRLTDGMETLKSAPIENLITAAVLQAGWRLAPGAAGELVVQSISEKQRPRRP